ncbi:MAG TPA: hypothetical protein VLA92_04425 [Candidatus Saccharimonadales bacterium]|nr:hypothetical protein [Candidatus Saccharimonadales bacterium]
MNSQTVDEITVQIKDDLRTAMKAGQSAEVSALRSLLARISNAEAVQLTTTAGLDDAPIAGAIQGVGSTEMARRMLSPDDVAAIIAAEVKELQDALAAVDEHSDYGQELRQKILTVSKYS